ncbi:DUF2812 domain-containing protein [Bacillales bacterium AN1005]|uniref:DUF2812 domain-containing protein n=1 Tax=Niallia taxi TaxID=2499688 RepID=UPI0011A8DADA|nr:DUF2812 domain-containing protein [Niallia taxi]MED3962765.1 DUF2812 domain-containing protein [Niallia taxi]
MKQTKYVLSGGLAFAEEKDMKQLRKLSNDGWHVSGFKFMGYTLKKGESADYIYSVDYRSLKDMEAEEYFEFFASSGWTHISSEGSIHLFRALPGTKPIYSDRETTAEKHVNSIKSMRWLVISMVFLTVFACLGALISTGTLQMVFNILAVVFLIVAIPASWTLIATYSNKWTAEGRKGLVTVVKALPIVFLLFVVLIIFQVFESISYSVSILAAMLIGGIVAPMIIWVIMSLYIRVRGNN